MCYCIYLCAAVYVIFDVTHVAWSARLSVLVLSQNVNPAKTAELMRCHFEYRFVWTQGTIY